MKPHSLSVLFAPSSGLFTLLVLATPFSSLTFLTGSARAATRDVSADTSGMADYFGAKPPGETPEIFAPGVVSRADRFEARLAFSRDFQECYLTETDATFSRPKLLMARRDKNGWTSFAPASFAAKFKTCHEPFISSDNQSLYFTADGDDSVPGNARDLWVVKRAGSGWSEPSRLPVPINSPSTEFFFAQAADGTVVFSSDRPGGLGHFDLYYVEKDENGVAHARNFGAPINSAGPEFDPCISPDSQTIIFASVRDGANNLDLFITHRGVEKTWSTPVRLRSSINTPANEYGGAFSPDGRYFFFVRHDGKQSDIYWMTAAQSLK